MGTVLLEEDQAGPWKWDFCSAVGHAASNIEKMLRAAFVLSSLHEKFCNYILLRALCRRLHVTFHSAL